MSIRKESLFMGYLRLPVLNSCQYSPLWGNSFSVILIYNKKKFFTKFEKKKKFIFDHPILALYPRQNPPTKCGVKIFLHIFQIQYKDWNFSFR
jgi:hypothetical protein